MHGEIFTIKTPHTLDFLLDGLSALHYKLPSCTILQGNSLIEKEEDRSSKYIKKGKSFQNSWVLEEERKMQI